MIGYVSVLISRFVSQITPTWQFISRRHQCGYKWIGQWNTHRLVFEFLWKKSKKKGENKKTFWLFVDFGVCVSVRIICDCVLTKDKHTSVKWKEIARERKRERQRERERKGTYIRAYMPNTVHFSTAEQKYEYTWSWWKRELFDLSPVGTQINSPRKNFKKKEELITRRTKQTNPHTNRASFLFLSIFCILVLVWRFGSNWFSVSMESEWKKRTQKKTTKSQTESQQKREATKKKFTVNQQKTKAVFIIYIYIIDHTFQWT